MTKMIWVLIFCLMPTLVYAEGKAVSESSVRDFAITANGTAWALLIGEPFVLEVHDSRGVHRISLKQMDLIVDVAPNPTIEWAGNGRYISVLYENSEIAATVEVFDLASFQRILNRSVGHAKWLKSRHFLICTPAADSLGELAPPGLVVFDAAHRKSRSIAVEKSFDGAIATGAAHVLAQEATLRDGGIVRRLVRLRVD